MPANSDTYQLQSYIVTEMPLTHGDIKKLQKILASSYKVNVLLLPLLVIIFFWGFLYFVIFAGFVILFNLVFSKNYYSTKHALAKTKIVITGIVTDVRKNEEIIINFGNEQFDITYTNVEFPIQINDTVSIHYSKNSNNLREHLLDVEVLN